jgi:hypothetical protein
MILRPSLRPSDLSEQLSLQFLRWQDQEEIEIMTSHLLTRRQFSARCAALSLSLPALCATAASATPARTVRLPDGTTVPALGQGAWHLGQGRHSPADEEAAVRAGISLGMTLLDTSGNYGNGRSEQFLSNVIADQRNRIYLVSKVESDEVSGDGIPRACAASLARLGTGHLDLYLLHSPVPSEQFAAVVVEFEKLKSAGKIRAWGGTVSTARRTRLPTASATAASSTTFCPGVHSTMFR